MFNFTSSLRIYLSVEPTDMRKSFNGLYAIAKHELERNPMDGSLFVFANRRRDRVKLLYWDGSGFWVLAKRLEKGTFWWPGPGEAKTGGLEIKPEALSMLLNGIDLKAGSLRAWFCR
ncbi:MAG TPA: IS66 family insertion sequence element accessory protein TnpB [Opitutales bacterium]|nr:IS66 family insertion sequence element accessory protein TnpB [Opitutales bacterium]